MNIGNNLLIAKNKIAYRKKDYPCNCCNCLTSNCQCSCYCKCHIRTILFPINKKNFSLKNYLTEDVTKNINKKLVKHNSSKNISNSGDDYLNKLKLSKNNNENKENENINNINNDYINNNNKKIKKECNDKPSNNSSLINKKRLNHHKSQENFDKLLDNKSGNKINIQFDKIRIDKENKVNINDTTNFNGINYNTFYNYSKPKNELNKNNFSTLDKDISNNDNNSNNNYLLYFMNNENLYKNQKKKAENKIINKTLNINILKEKKENNNKFDNNLINKYLSESTKSEINEVSNNKYSKKCKKEKDNDLIDFIKKYNNKKVKNKNTLDFKISKFEIEFIKNGLTYKENEKLIKILEKKIQQLENKLKEANEKIYDLNKIIINDKVEIFRLEEELKENKTRLKCKKNSTNIIGRNNDSLIIKLPENFQTFKLEKDANLTDDNNKIFNPNHSVINDCKIYKKKISSKIFKKINTNNRTLSQPDLHGFMNIKNSKKRRHNSLLLEKNSLLKQKLFDNKKLIYAIYSLPSNQKLLSFDLISKNFSLKDINTSNYNDFNKNYIESFRQEESQYNSIYLFNNNILYIVTGKNSDIFYIYDITDNTLSQKCNLKNNHANGVLLLYKNKVFCLSGKFNKKVEVYSEENNEWREINEMNVERSFFSACIIQNKYIFCLFGYSTPTNKYLDSIEFCDITNLNIDKCIWKYLKYNNYNNIYNMNICGFISMNYNDDKIIIFGGINGVEKKPVNKFYQIVLGKNFEIENNSDKNYIEEINMESNDTNENKCYYFVHGFGIFKGDDIDKENKNKFYAGFDSNYNIHVIQIKNKFIHDVYYYNK